jgi:hypothetical protein
MNPQSCARKLPPQIDADVRVGREVDATALSREREGVKWGENGSTKPSLAPRGEP